jgi:hypothetical protein
MYLREIGRVGMDLIDVVQGSVRLKAFMNTVIKLRFHNIFGYS